MRDLHLRPGGAPKTELVRYPDAKPTFIIGSVPSGTSAMMAGLREGAGIRGFNEGVLAQLLPVMLSLVRQHYVTHRQKPLMTMLGSVSEEFLATGIKNVVGEAFIETMGEGRWLDETPGGAAVVAACPVLLEIFPNATFAFCKRRGIENILSRQQKLPDTDFEEHCRAWASTMEAWRATVPQLDAHAVEVDQAEMVAAPDAVAEKVGALLGLSAQQREGLRNVLRAKRPEETRTAQDDMPIALADTGWSESEREAFRRICGPMMEAFGYGMTGAARRD